MDLDTAIQMFDLGDTFEEYKKGLLQVLTRVHSPKELDRARKVIDEKKQYMIENNPEFNAIMENRKRETKQRAELDRAVHKAKMAEVEAKAKTIRADAMSRVKGAYADQGLDDFVASTRFKMVDPEELERKSEEELWCPICREKDTSNNIVNNNPTCMKDMHRLVPKSELKDYNRSYRRKWGKRRKK